MYWLANSLFCSLQIHMNLLGNVQQKIKCPLMWDILVVSSKILAGKMHDKLSIGNNSFMYNAKDENQICRCQAAAKEKTLTQPTKEAKALKEIWTVECSMPVVGIMFYENGDGFLLHFLADQGSTVWFLQHIPPRV